MVEEVEGFRAELEPSALVDGKTLKETKVEIQTSGQCKSVAADIAERKLVAKLSLTVDVYWGEP